MSWTTYALHPWGGWNINTRDWYVPDLLYAYGRKTRYAQTVPMRIDFAAAQTRKMIWTGMYGAEGNWNAISDTALWLERLYPAGWRQEMELYSYGEGMGLHKFHELVTFFRAGGGRSALRQITQQYVAAAMMQTLERLAFNAYLSKTKYYIQGHPTATNFSSLVGTDLYDYSIIPDLELDFKGMELPEIEQWAEQAVQMVAFVSPGQTHAVKTTTASWRDLLKYTDVGLARLFRGEVGSIYGTRFVESNMNVLFNFKPDVVAPVAVAIQPGDGGPNPATTKVDGVRMVGQLTAGSVAPTYYIQLGDNGNGGAETWDLGWTTDLATSMAKFKQGDMLTIYVDQAGASEDPFVQYGPKTSDGYICFRQVESVDTANGRLTFSQPIQKPYTTIQEAASGAERPAYAWVAKGLHVHAAIHMAAFGAVAGGVGQSPQLHFPIAVDDREAMFRTTWDGVMAMALFRPDIFHIVYSAGNYSARGFKGLGAV